MKARSFALIFAVILLVCAGLPGIAAADTSHIRIIRLSLVQGDVRFASSFHGDSLTDSKAVWETAPLNMPIREGSALATGAGRAEVEFENGAMAFLSANSVLEFYDLSLHDGEKITRLVLRQGTGVFYVRSQSDYFSVTGGDFTVEAGPRSRFRLNNFDDGSTVDVEAGQVSILRDDKTTPLDKGQSLSVRASDLKYPVIARADPSDDFDHWVSGRIDNAVAATNYTNQFTSTANYSSGFSDLYTFGSWYSMAGYGYGWRPFGVGLGWCPFDAAYGNWYMDASIGWSFIGSAPWGWLPYHYGGWIYSPAYGWMWTPNGFAGVGGRPIAYRPVTAVWVNTGGRVGFVPAHPSDKSGKTPLNVTHGVYPVQGNRIASPVAISTGEKVSVVKHLPADAPLVTGNVARTNAPALVSRTLPANTFTTRQAGVARQSSIMYDPAEHRFVNSGQAVAATSNVAQPHGNVAKVNEATAGHGNANLPAARPTTSFPTAAHNSVPARPSMTPAPARVGGGSSGGSSSGGGAGWGGGRSSGSSIGSSMPASSAPSSHPSSTGGGGRPH